MPPVYNQGDIGSCTANALAGAYQFSHATKWCPSRLMLYYGERQIDAVIEEDPSVIQLDQGSRLEEGIIVMKDCGVVPEQLWPYLENCSLEEHTCKPNETPAFMHDPSCAVWKAAQHHKIQEAFKVEPTEESVKWVLSQGSPIAFAMLVYNECWSQAAKENGNLPNLEDGDEVVGGHAILLVGYDESTGRFKFRNSWGEEFGDHGYGTITPENFFACLNDNLWVIDPSPKVAAAAQQTNL